MSVLLMGTVKAFVRGAFASTDVVDVEYYGGEFSSDEVAVSGFKAPAILIAGLGWTRPRGHERMTGKGCRVCHMAAFVVTSNNNRVERMLAAQRLSEQLDLQLTTWTPANADDAVIEVAAPEDDIRCENVYNKKIDAKGLALWLVTWRQAIKPRLPLPQLYELLGIDIVSTNVLPHISPEGAEGGDPIAVTHEILFQPPTA